MQALVLEAKNILTLQEVSPPEPRADELLIEVKLCSIGGSEYMALANPGIRPLPHIMGHGISGTAPQAKRVAVYPLRGCGDCNYCQEGLTQLCDDWALIGVQLDGGFAQQVAIPEANLVDLPGSLSWEQSAFIEPFANAVNAWELAQIDPKNTVAIIGAGGLGLGLVALASETGCDITVSDLSETRRSVASQLGATYTTAKPQGHFDVVFETFGSVESRRRALEITKRGGKCIFMGFATASLDVNISNIIRHQKHLMGSFVYSLEQFRKAVNLAESCLAEWVTNLSFNEVEPVLNAYLKGDFSIAKAALRPNRT